jgi:hypothetical protein
MIPVRSQRGRYNLPRKDGNMMTLHDRKPLKIGNIMGDIINKEPKI